MSPRPARTGRDKTPKPPRWWDEAAHFVVLHRSITVSGVVESDPENPYEREAVVYGVGEELPRDRVTPSVWRGFGDRIAALNEAGERLDKRSMAEQAGDIDPESALRSWRSENSLSRRVVEVYECGECGKTFETLDALNGHQSAHVERAEDVEAESGVESGPMSERLDDGREQA